MSVCSNLVKTISSKLGSDLYKLNVPQYQNSLIVGIDLIHFGNGRYIGCSATTSKKLTQCYSKLYKQAHPEVTEQDFDKYQTRSKRVVVERKITESRAEYLANFIAEAMAEYRKNSSGQNPEKVIIYRDGMGGP